MTKTTTETLHLGFNPGNRNSVLTLYSGSSLKEKTASDLSAYAPFTPNFLTSEPGTGAIVHNDQVYQVGLPCDGQTGAFTFTSIDKYSDNDGLQILLKSLLIRMLPQGKGRSYNANMAFGMPKGWMTDHFMEQVRESFAGVHELSTPTKNHGTVTIKPESIKFFHEPFGGYVYLRSLKNLEVSRYCNILDVGFDTSDTFTFENGKIVHAKTLTVDKGMYDLYATVQSYFQANDMGRRRPIADIETAIQEHGFNGSSGPIDRMIAQFVSELTNEVSASWKGIRNKENLALLGGGGSFLRPIFESAQIPVLEVPYPQLANSKGLGIIARTS